jgi:16S rRNA (cytidine1402-2'-O)-methyltransferase
MKEPGKLYIVSTPIGNLEDITYRAISTLKNSFKILSENSKNSKKLLEKYEIQTPCSTLFASTKSEDMHWILESIQDGNDISYISDAGTPGISDPGNKLVRFLRSSSIQIVPIPGPSTLSTLLSVSGSQNTPCVFLGFLNEKKAKRRKELEEWASKDTVLVYFESVHRIFETLDITREVFPKAEILIGRELTKIYESLIVWKPDSPKPSFPLKGEFAVLINNFEKKIAKEILNIDDTND